MTDETNDFAAFETAAIAGEEPPVADDETNTGETVEEVDPPEENPEVNDETDEPEKSEEDDKGKRRSKPASERIAEITRDKHEAIRRAEAAEARVAALEAGKPQDDGQPAPTELVEPSPDDFEFGEADPGYLRALAKYEVKVELAAERAEQTKQAETQALVARGIALDTGWKEQAEKATERYDDFAETIENYKSKEPCPKLLALAIQASEYGADVAYHLAKNPTENRELAHWAEVDPLEAARRFGRLEARFESRAEPKPEPKRMTDAPEPPRHNVRGSGGKFGVSADTTDFAAFELKANAEASGRR